MTQAIQRRLSNRDKVSSLVRVRPSDTQLLLPEAICTTENSSRQGLYFVVEKYAIRQRVQLFLSFPNKFDPTAMFREYLAEVVRVDSLSDTRFGIAIRLLHDIQLRLRDGLIVPETGFWRSWPPVEAGTFSVFA